MSPYVQGLLLTSLGVLILSPDSALIRLINLDPPSIMAWRGLGASFTFTLMVLVRHGKNLKSYLSLFWPMGLLAVPFAAGMQFNFVLAVSLTSPAIVLILVGATPFVSALVAWVLLKQRTPKPTLIAIAIGFVGVTITMIGEQGAEVTLIGNLIALTIPITIALLFVTIQAIRVPDAWIIFALAQFAGAVFMFTFFEISAPPTAFDGAMMALNGLIVGSFAMGLITLGLRQLPSAEVSLLLTGETIIGPFLVWWLVGLKPGFWTWIGGLLVLTALFGNAFWRIRQQRLAKAAAA